MSQKKERENSWKKNDSNDRRRLVMYTKIKHISCVCVFEKSLIAFLSLVLKKMKKNVNKHWNVIKRTPEVRLCVTYFR